MLRYPLHFIDFFRDSRKYLKDHKRETKHYPINHIKKSTVYPDGIYPDCTTEDFNKWSNYINKQLN